MRVLSNGSDNLTGVDSNESNGVSADCDGSARNPTGGSGSRWMCSAQPVSRSDNTAADSFKSPLEFTNDARLFVAKRFDRIEPGGPARGPDAEEQTNADAERRREADRFGRHE